MVLLISLVLLLLLTALGLSSMQGATSQEQLAGSIRHRNLSFQAAEDGLRRGESAVQAHGVGLPTCQSQVTCAPPKEAYAISHPGVDPVSAIAWVGLKGASTAFKIWGPVSDWHICRPIPRRLYIGSRQWGSAVSRVPSWRASMRESSRMPMGDSDEFYGDNFSR